MHPRILRQYSHISDVTRAVEKLVRCLRHHGYHTLSANHSHASKLKHCESRWQ